MAELADALRDPIPLAPNRIPRFYRGGRLLEAFRGDPNAEDDDRPEDWVGSATRAWTRPGTAGGPLGLSEVDVDGRRLTLEHLLALAPEALVGAAFAEAVPRSLGVLVKLLDAGERLPVHCHPTREAAARLLGSRFGKTEAWVILGTRGPTSRVWAGFRQAVGPGELRRWIDHQETDALLGALVEHEVSPGDAMFIPAGTPHAIGPGVFLLELQEPTDFSVVAETRGFPIAPDDASLGLGWDQALGFFGTDPSPDLRQPPSRGTDGSIRLLGPAADPYFRAVEIEVRDERGIDTEPCYAVAVVVDGSGRLRGAAIELSVHRGSTLAIPAAAMPELKLSSDDGMRVMLCLPPEPQLVPGQPG